MRLGDKAVRSALLCLLGSGALALAACGSSSNNSGGGGGSGGGSSNASSGGGTIKVGAALIGPKNDKSFNQAAYEGIVQATKEDPRLKLTSVLENRDTSSNETDAVQTLAPIDQIFVGVSAAFGPVFDAEASKFPNTTFITLFGAPKLYHKNVYSFVPDRGAPAYEAGVLSGKLTKTKIVGFVGGASIPPTEQSLVAYKAGVASVDPSIKVESNIIGDFNDVAKAKAATQAMLADNADVIMPYLDAGIVGAYAAGKATGKNPPMFHLDFADCSLYSNIIGTDMANNTLAADKMLKGLANHTLQPAGEAVFVGLQDPTLQQLKLCPKYAKNAKIAAAAKQTIDGLNSGKIKLPAAALNPRPNWPYRIGFNGPVQNAGKTG